MDQDNLALSTSFVRDAALPPLMPTRSVMGAEDAEETPPPDFAAPDLAVTVGSQIASFGEGLDASIKESISNGFLFAQQVADKHVQDTENATTEEWYNSYVDVLSRIGWNRENRTNSLKEMNGVSTDVHKEIIPIVVAALGPVAATATVVRVLEGLQNMNEASPWITLFSKSSRRATANQFQMSHTYVENGVPRISLVAFELTAERKIAQVLFFKLSTDSAKLSHFETKMAVDIGIFDSVAPIIADRLKERAKDFILSIPLL